MRRLSVQHRTGRGFHNVHIVHASSYAVFHFWPTELIYLSLPLLAESLFLCFFFRETRTLLCPIAFAATVTILEKITPLEPTAIEYTTLVSLICYTFLVPIMQAFMAEVKEQDAKFEVVEEVDSGDQADVDVRLSERFE